MVDEADKDEDIAETETDEAEGKQKKRPSTAVIIILAVLLASVVIGGVVGLTMYLLGDDAAESAAAVEKKTDAEETEGEETEEGVDEAENTAAVEGPVEYHRLDPKFVVSFHDQSVARFMQFSIQIMTRDKNVIKQIQEHNPAVRSSLLMLFDSQNAEVMTTREGKEQLLKAITEDINRTLEQLVGISGVEAAYFETFLIQ